MGGRKPIGSAGIVLRLGLGLTSVLVYYYSHTDVIHMDLPVDAHTPTPTRQPLAEPAWKDGLTRGPAWPSNGELAGSSRIDSSGVTPSIEDLKRSGYRPLCSRSASPQRACVLGGAPESGGSHGR
jgi:hypothetical protein